MRFGGQDVTYSSIDLTSGGAGALEIVVSPNAAEIAGVARTEQGDAAPDTLVTLWPAHASAQVLARSVRVTRSDNAGKYTFSDLAPGEYRVAAWEQVEAAILSAPEFLQAFESAAAAANVKEGARETVELRLISADAAETEAAKLR
jgi:hypothetical protein